MADLARAGAGLNPQEQPSFFDPLPEVAALRLSRLDGGRVFSYGLDHSPAFRELTRAGRAGAQLTSLFLHRQLLAPYANVLDRVEAPEAGELAALLPRPRERGPELYDPARVGELLPWLRNAGVARVLSLDPLPHPELVPLASIPAGPPGVAIHAYGFDSWPRASLACRATPVASREQALAVPYRKGFDPWREVALEEQGGGPDDALAGHVHEGPRPAHLVDRRRGALRGHDERERLSRGARQSRSRLAGARRRRARARAARERQAPCGRGVGGTARGGAALPGARPRRGRRRSAWCRSSPRWRYCATGARRSRR